MIKTLQRAVATFVDYALDDAVIQQAFDNSVDSPEPMPAQFEVKDGRPVLDEDGNKEMTSEYKFYLKTIARPRDVSAFKRHLLSALSYSDGELPLLIISKYSGNVWWGGSYYNFSYKNEQRLQVLSPPRGYLYIRLNVDRMSAGSTRRDDPRFWASKIAHEILHNLGYWHPNYADPADRDRYNQGSNRSFLVAYEMFLLEKLGTLPAQP